MNWTLKYRPDQIKKLHLKETRRQLLKFLKDGFIPQVLLFAGPKGTGKTSSSRLVAAVLNEAKNKAAIESVYFEKEKPKKPLVEPNTHDPLIQKILTGKSYVVQEIDAASYRGIDDVRELKNRAFTPPVEGLMSVFILDEVHMLTTPAFNALLKLLEEPPEHAVFILATTEPEKIPETVISRCQVLRFRKATQAEILEALKQVVKQEKLKVDQETLKLLADLADGSFRDAVKYLELATENGQVSLEKVESLLGGSFYDQSQKFLELIITKDAPGITQLFHDLREKQANERVFHQAFVKLLHSYLTQEIKAPQSAPINTTISLYLIKQFNDPTLSETVIPFLGLELKALDIIEKSQKSKDKRQKFKVKSLKPKVASLELEAEGQKPVTTQKMPVSKSKIHNLKSKITQPDLGDGQAVISQWEKLLNLIEKKNSTIAALLRSAKPTKGDRGKVVVEVYYRFHQEQLTSPKILNLLQDVLGALSLGFVEFEFILKEPTEQTSTGDIVNRRLAPAPAVVSHKEETNLVKVASQVLM